MRMIDCPNQAFLNEILKYDAAIGKLFWRKRAPETFLEKPRKISLERTSAVWNSINADKEAFTANSCGKRAGAINGRNYLAHRIIWKMVHGTDPAYIDHINGDPLDNRLVNLRSVTNQENMRNMSKPKSNSSGFIGVAWHGQASKWRAYVMIDGTQKSLGLFTTAEAANAARLAASEQYGFHQNHGR